jgi:hypothetical protein
VKNGGPKRPPFFFTALVRSPGTEINAKRIEAFCSAVRANRAWRREISPLRVEMTDSSGLNMKTLKRAGLVNPP